MSQESGATPQLIANEPKVIDVLVDLYWQSRMGNSGYGASLKRRLASNKTRVLRQNVVRIKKQSNSLPRMFE
jgi:hypothetical protein